MTSGRQRVAATFAVSAMLALGGCSTATKEQEALGKVFRGGDVPIYLGGIDAKYTVIKQLSEARRQICGPNYYDALSGGAWMAAAGKAVGADAVINYHDVTTDRSLFSCGTFTASGTAVKFAK